MDGVGPPRRDGGGAVAGAEQRPGDGRDGVGVVADRDRRLERRLQVGGAVEVARRVDRRPCRLERAHRPAVGREAVRVRQLGLVDPRLPPVRRLLGEEVQPAPDIELRHEDRDSHGLRPQHAGLHAEHVRMGQRRRVGRGLSAVLSVVQRDESDDARAHQRPIARAIAEGKGTGDLGHPEGQIGAGRDAVEHVAGQVADVGRAPFAPLEEPRGDGVEARVGVQVPAIGGDQGDARGHLGVVGPLAGLVRSETSADHLRCADHDTRLELVGDAEGISNGLTQQDAGCAVLLGLGEGDRHVPNLRERSAGSRLLRRAGSVLPRHRALARTTPVDILRGAACLAGGV